MMRGYNLARLPKEPFMCCKFPALRTSSRLCLALGGLVMACAAPLTSAQMTESPARADSIVHLRIARPEHPVTIPETLFGSFLEPIGHSTYGGLWADVIENPSFEEGLWSAHNVEVMVRERPELRRASELGLPLPWEPLVYAQGNRYAPVRGDAANSAQSVLIMSLPGKEVGISQQVYLPVHRELAYNGSVWIKHVRGGAAVTVSLRRHAHPDQTFVSATIDASSSTWTKYSFALTLKSGQVAPHEPCDLVISLADDARAMVDNVLLNPADAVDGMDPDVIALARDLHTPVVRFGGNFTSAYDWRDGVGPLDKRVSKLNLSWGIPEYNTFGMDEFLRFCQLIHAEPQVALNLGTGDPQAAADWVRYIDDHWADRKGGNLWELGNELWGDFQVGYPSQQRIAAVTLATSQAVHAVDPRSRLIATGGDEDFFHDWNAQQLSNPPGTFDFLSTHFVVNDFVQLPHASNEFRSMAALALPTGLGGKMRAIREQSAGTHPDVHVAFTEWLMVSDSRSGPNFTNMGGALFAGGLLNMVIANADVVSISDMTGILEFGGIWKKRSQVYAAPAYWVLRAYATAQPHSLLKIVSDSPAYSISKGITRLPEIANVPYLDVVAALSQNGSKLVLLCVNRDLHRSQAAEIDLSEWMAAAAPAKVTTLTAENILQENDEEEPGRVAPVTQTEAAGKTFRHKFPNASVTVIEVPVPKK